MSYEIQEDWQMQAPGWRDLQIHKCLCTMKSLIEQLPAPSVQPLVYRALISQTSNNAPTEIILENTLGEVPTFSYVGDGAYRILSGGIFTVGKTFVNLQIGATYNPSRFYGANIGDINDSGRIEFWVSSNDGTTTAPQNDILVNAFLEILIYP